MKPIGKRILACLVTACLLLGCISFLSGVLMRKSGAYNYYGFFSQEEEFDVLFFGSSHVVNGVMPMELWRDWGIVSFNMANTGCMIPTSYWMLELALRYKTPSVAVIDCMGLESNFKTFPERFEQVSVTLDAFPLSRTKIRAAMDLLDDPYMDEAIANGETEAMEGRDPLSLLWPFSIYHRRWKELKASDFVPSYNREKGGRMMAGRMRQRNIGAISPEAKQKPVYKQIVRAIRKKMFNYGRTVLETDITPEMVEFLIEETGAEKSNYYFASQEDIVIHSVIARKITVEERKAVIPEMAKNFDFKLYSVSSTKKHPEIKNMGPVDFRKTAPLIFNQSKINLYITPRAIVTGIPLRVLEIMSCQGFVLTNYQEDLEREFVEGKEIVMYRSFDELMKKTEYYLSHEDERKAIARAGYEKVMRDYNFAVKLSEIFTKDSCGGFLI